MKSASSKLSNSIPWRWQSKIAEKVQKTIRCFSWISCRTSLSLSLLWKRLFLVLSKTLLPILFLDFGATITCSCSYSYLRVSDIQRMHYCHNTVRRMRLFSLILRMRKESRTLVISADLLFRIIKTLVNEDGTVVCDGNNDTSCLWWMQAFRPGTELSSLPFDLFVCPFLLRFNFNIFFSWFHINLGHKS